MTETFGPIFDILNFGFARPNPIYCILIYGHKGAIHTRRLELDNNGCNVIDQISSRSDRATLRWRFDPNVFGNLPSLNASSSKTLSIAADGFTVDIQCEHPFTARWIEGWGSRHYYHKTALPVLEIVLERVTSAEIVTIIREAA